MQVAGLFAIFPMKPFSTRGSLRVIKTSSMLLVSVKKATNLLHQLSIKFCFIS